MSETAQTAAAAQGARESQMPSVYYAGPSTGIISKETEVTGGVERKYRLALAAVAAIIIILVLVIVYHIVTTKRFVAKLTKCGWTAYFLEGCGWCDKQLAILPGFDQYVVYKSDGTTAKSYTALPPLAFGDITSGFPLWYNVVTGEKRTGFQNAAALAKMAQC